MAVEITGLPSTPVSSNSETTQSGVSSSAPSSAKKAGSDNSQNTSGATPAAADTVTITRQAEYLQMLEVNVNSQSEIDSDRVARLKVAIDTGQYDIDPLRVAEKLIKFESELAA